MDSILNSVKKMLGIDSEYTHFDPDITININTVLSILHQIGLPRFHIEDEGATWNDYISLLDDSFDIEDVKTYVFMKVKMMFDTPSGAAADAYNNLIAELEWRLNIETDKGE